MTKVDLTPAFLIHRRAYKDSSLLLDFLTKEHGKIRLIAKGIRKSKTSIQMFQCLNISFVGKAELKTLTNWEVDDVPRHLKSEALILSMYVNELISRLLQEQDPHVELFEIYKKFVNQVGSLKQDSRHWLLRMFENNLLAELGYAVDFVVDVNGNEINQNSSYEYQQQAGFLQSSTGKISGKLLHQLSAGDVENRPNLEQLKACRDLNRQRLNPLLGNKPLKSRSLFFTKQ